MLTLQRIKISNFLSYQELDVDLTKFDVCQLVGNNGVGKTNLLAAITEASYGKNIRGYSKEELSNRYTDIEGYTLSLEYTSGTDKYVAVTKRTASKVTVSLKKNGNDISGHTVKDTYKIIEDSFGYTYDMFCQLVYQSSDFSMNFLQATPAVRRKFLLNFTDASDIQSDIDKATEDNKVVKLLIAQNSSVKEKVGTSLTTLRGKLANLQSQLSADSILSTEDECHRIIKESELQTQQLQSEIENYDRIKDSLARAKSALNGLSVAPCPPLLDEPEMLPVPPSPDASPYLVLKAKVEELGRTKVNLQQQKARAEASIPADKCHTCGSKLSNDDAIAVHKDKIAALVQSLGDTEEGLARVNAEYKVEYSKWFDVQQAMLNAQKHNKIAQDARDKNAKNKADYDTALARYEGTKVALTEQVDTLQLTLSKTEEPDASRLPKLQADKLEAEALLKQIKQETSLRDAIRATQLAIEEQEASLAEVEKEARAIMLRNAISTTLVTSLKEVLAKTFEDSLQLLERLTNKYLAVFSNGNFAIKFVADSTNLNIQLFNRGVETKLHTASKGQTTRITISCLLAIRKLLTSMAKQPINLLILDEVVGVLDSDGKEQLLNILENEHDLNIFLVSHEWSHPLLSKIYVTVDNKGFTHYDYE